ncbi:MAG TPA: TadE family protein [Actinomycetota bacterium]|nr:TadE family protein [Actinomycetota bacterium]
MTARRQDGSASVEVVGMLPWLFMAGLLVWQILLVTFVATSAENAARNGSRAEGLGRDGRAAAVSSLTSWLQDETRIQIDGERVTVTVGLPLIVPWVTSDNFTVTRRAELPSG